MAKESFQDSKVAKILNKYYVSVKVDREERPDIDSIYMKVCQSITGSGGWPLTIIMTPEQKPFFAGTYFPKDNMGEALGLTAILEYIQKAWKNNKDELLKEGDSVLDIIYALNKNSPAQLSEDILKRAFLEFKRNFDTVYGGFGGYPKFPSTHNLLFLLRYFYKTKDAAALEMVEKTLESMYRGGMYDHIGYGFSRYSVDRKWLIPHFEKMLYDNALMVMAYLETFQVTGNRKYAKVAEEVLEYILRDMTSKEGGFYSAEDADSEGEEGKFYMWSQEEIKDILGQEQGSKFCYYFNITSHGNFRGKNVPNLIGKSVPTEDIQLIKNCRDKLFKYREKRVRPHKDDKILTSWNGLMIAAMALAGRVLNNSKYTLAGKKAVDFIYKNLIRKDGRLLARYREGESSFMGYADDYAFLIWGLIELYETTYNPEYLKNALELNENFLEMFWDNENGGFFLYGKDSEKLIIRPKEIYDGPTPCGNSAAVLNLIRLSYLTTGYEFEDKVKHFLQNFAKEIESSPISCSFSLISLLFLKYPVNQVIISEGRNTHEVKKALEIINKKYRPFTISILYSHLNRELKNIYPSIEKYIALGDKTTAYVCENFVCREPITDIDILDRIL